MSITMITMQMMFHLVTGNVLAEKRSDARLSLSKRALRLVSLFSQTFVLEKGTI